MKAITYKFCSDNEKGRILFTNTVLMLRTLVSDPGAKHTLKNGYIHYIQYSINHVPYHNPTYLCNEWLTAKSASDSKDLSKHYANIETVCFVKKLINTNREKIISLLFP